MKQIVWEYKVTNVRRSEVSETLQHSGRQGWELVMALKVDTVFVDLIFKRPKQVQA